MPIIIPKDIPAYETLKKKAFVMDTARATSQDIRPLEILIVNLMPVKIQTENQILSLLANSPLQINITLLTTESYVGKNTPKSHLKRFYVHFDQIAERNFDGAILTGAPIEHLKFEEAVYWEEIVKIMDYLRRRCTSTLYLCWGAMAGLYYFYGIGKQKLPQKLFGVFKHKIVYNDLILSGLGDTVRIPHSRHSKIDEKAAREAARKTNIKILLEGEKSGISMLKDHKDVFMLGHPEYSRGVLHEEYGRDLRKGLKIKKPQNYYDRKGETVFEWRADASVIFGNWLNFCVYQDTYFELEKISDIDEV